MLFRRILAELKREDALIRSSPALLYRNEHPLC
jgi:hypothetical protein